MRRLAVVAALLALGLTLCLSSASANHAAIEQISVGPTGGNGPHNSVFRHATPDGVRVLFTTPEQLVSADTDAQPDIYERANGFTTLITPGTASTLSYRGASDDGTKVFFHTNEALVPEDTDGAVNDVYEAEAGVISLVSKGPLSGSPFGFSGFLANSPDGTRVIFHTTDQLVSGDTDGGASDVYGRDNGTTTSLVSTSDTAPNTADPSSVAHMSPDGLHVYFLTSEKLDPDDTDSGSDMYERSGGATKLVSAGEINGDSAYPVNWVLPSPDPDHVLFNTAEALVPEDTDTCNSSTATPGCTDIYEWDGSTAKLVTASESGPSGGDQHVFQAFASDDGTHIAFSTSDQLVPADIDTVPDIYERFAGHTTLVSTGPAGGSGPWSAVLYTISGDGSHIFIGTQERLTPDDVNEGCGPGCMDLYDWTNGTTALVSTGPGEAPAANSSPSSVLSAFDGSRVFYSTREALVPEDPTDEGEDVYEHVRGMTFLIPPNGAGASHPVHIRAAGTLVFFEGNQSVVPADTDSATDVYVAGTFDAYGRPKAATPINIAFVPAYQACASPTRVHAAPLSFGSCAPPAQVSQYLTLGTPDANGAAAKSVSNLRLLVLPGNPSTPASEADARYEVSITDVRNQAGLTDYTGALELDAPLQITDRSNPGPDTGNLTATGSQPDFPVLVPCAATGDTTVGSTCSVTTTANTIAPGAAVEGKRAIWETGQVRVSDGGADGNPGTSDGEGLFLVQGVFIP